MPGAIAHHDGAEVGANCMYLRCLDDGQPRLNCPIGIDRGVLRGLPELDSQFRGLSGRPAA